MGGQREKIQMPLPDDGLQPDQEGHKAFANNAEKLKGVPETAERKSGSKA
jgi:hypothetical protein